MSISFGRDLDYIITITRDALEDIQDEVTGQIVNTAQAIEDIWEIDCEGFWITYVKTAITAAGAALYLLLTPSLEEILESYLQPKPGRRGGRRGRGKDRNRGINKAGQRRLYFKPGIPDIDNAIADAIPGRGLLAGRKVGPGEYIFWSGVDVADRFLWYWLLIEATETFSTVWMSEILESGKCKTPVDGAFQLTTPTQTPFGSNNLWFSKWDCSGLHENNITVLNNGKAELPLNNQEGTALIICLGTFFIETDDSEGEGEYEIGVRVVAHNSNGDVIEDQETVVSLFVGPNASITRQVDASTIVKDFHDVELLFIGRVITGRQYDTFECSAHAAVSVRAVQIV